MKDLGAADLAACRVLLAGGSKSFRAASRLLPARIATPAAALYGFCRVADDAIDEAPDPAAALPALQARLDAILAGRPQHHPADRAFAVVVRDFGIPRALPAALVEGFAWDAAGRRYADLAALEGYAARVAASVGVMMTLLMGVRDPVALARACDLGVAMQLTNIARDVGADAQMGRLYLPLDWMAEAGLEAEAFLAAPRFTPALGDVVRRLLRHADTLYARAEQGFAYLPWDCRAGIGAARHVYAAIGRAVEGQGGDSVTHRAVVSGSAKARLMARGMTALAARPARHPAPPLPAVRFLVEAVGTQAVPPALADRIARAVALFDRLGQNTALGPMTR
ncbi:MULTISPECIES: phytoene/squalene synthase family protein [Roseomonadaceae]|uniref:Phytoene/squalene synthase family protein n=1 Tax=Falsiroseomonas oleicola TaxID=2801474 RepID=A0ABS6H2E9_9PROT|nr:phytoene/squalene synthase family protein [Roseomonas oleicola]MBU8542842.1 phytoene/squalene synthase family protein [Roseomonas oleicola]